VTTDTQAAGDANNPAGVQANADGKPADGTGATDNAAKTAAAATADANKGDADKDAEEFAVKAPEGYEFDEARLADFKAVAKELKLPNVAAQKLVELVSKHEQNRLDAYVKQVSDWADAVKADKDIGGDKLQESAAVARKALDLGPPELKEFLNTSGLGNHPLMFKWAYAIGKAMSEDKVVKGNPASGVKSAADVLYGDASSSKT
jgi:hypothetical protein